MKFYIFISCVIFKILTLDCQVIPKYLPKLCPTSTPNYGQCSLKVLSKWGPYLLKGIKEINFPKLHPLNIPIFIVNRTLNEQVAVDAILRNIVMYGLNATTMKDFKFDPNNKKGEMHLHIPSIRATIEYDVTGHIFTLDIGNSGYFKGVTSDIELSFEFTLKPVERLGITYFTFDYFLAKSTIGDSYIQLVSKNPEFQFAADLITNFFNEDPKPIIDAVHPIYEESVNYFYKHLAEQVLATVPAAEILPE